MEKLNRSLCEDLEKIQSESPLVHNITNFVVMNFTANALLSMGASPVMAHAATEVEDMVSIAHALVINIGTLNPDWVTAMKIAVRKASSLKKPVILDPVGAGATRYRTEVVRSLVDIGAFSVIRGNASEIQALVGSDIRTRGVDSTTAADSAIEAARRLSDRSGCVVVISGPTDYVVEGSAILKISNGDPIMTRVTGMGCTATALIGAFCAVNSNYFQAAAHAMGIMGIAGEMAAAASQGPGSFQMAFLDTLYAMDTSEIQGRLNVER